MIPPPIMTTSAVCMLFGVLLLFDASLLFIRI
jgi:hypothetical protein